MALTPRIFYAPLAVQVSPSPSTGFMFQTGVGGPVTGSNSGINLIRTLSRVQSVNDSFDQTRQNVGQLGQLAILAKMITEPPNAPLEVSWYVADVSNDLICGFYVSGDQSAITNIVNLTQADKNYFIQVAPPGQDAIGWTGASQCKYVTNGYLSSYSTQGAVGGLPTTTVGVQGFNWVADTGSVFRPLLAIDYVAGTYVQNKYFTLPVAGSGLANAVPAIRPSEITASFSPSNIGIGINAADLKLQSYNIGFNLNPQKLTQMGSFFPYSLQPTFPVDVTASLTAFWGDLVTGSLAGLQCNDQEYRVDVTLRQPSCILAGASPGAVAAKYTLLGAKLDSQSFTEQYTDVASQVTLNLTTSLGGPTDANHNFFISGISV